MTAEEIAALPIGTEVLVRMKLASPFYGGTVQVAGLGHLTIYQEPENIHSIAPPKPLEVGETVQGEGYSSPVTIVAIDGRSAWVRTVSNNHFTEPLVTLTRIQNEAA